MPSQKCTVAFSNLAGIDDAHYCSTHGHSPGILTVTTRIYPFNLNYYASCYFSDGTSIYPIPDCRVKSIAFSSDEGGHRWMVQVEDHRWRWQNSLISGTYNVEDNRGNLIPGMIKTPRELAILCLDRLGETEYEIDMPEGVKEKEGPRDEFPPPGEGIKSVKAELNPPTNWVNISTAEALVRLCEVYDRAVIWCNLDRKVKIQKRSQGEGLPGGLVESGSDSLFLPPMPSGIGIIGAEIRWQLRFGTEDVGLEFDGRLRKIDDLSYAPDITPRPASYQVILAGLYNGATVYTLVVEGRSFGITGAGSDTATFNAIAAQINADTVANQTVTAVVTSAPALIVTGLHDGRDITVGAGPGATMVPALNQSPIDNKWQFSNPPVFANVNGPETGGPDRLSFNLALARAQDTVFRTRRITLLDPGKGPLDPPDNLYVKHFGYVTRYQQILLEPTKVEQVVPQPRDPDRIQGGTGDLIADVPDYYDGYSRDRQHEVFGAVMRKISAPVFRIYRSDKSGSERFNNDFKDRVEVPSTVDPQNWCIRFSTPVFEYFKPAKGDGSVKKARLVLETSCRLRDPKTNEIVRYRRWVKLGRQEESDKTKEKRDTPKKLARLDNDEDCLKYDRDPNILWFDHSDEVFRTWKQTYTVDEARRRHVVKDSVNDQYDNAKKAADAYIDKHLERIILEGGYTRVYREVKPIKLNGAIREVTLSFSASGLSTTASYNREHDRYVPTNDVRRFREALAPNVEAAKQNRQFAKPITDSIKALQQGLARMGGG